MEILLRVCEGSMGGSVEGLWKVYGETMEGRVVAMLRLSNAVKSSVFYTEKYSILSSSERALRLNVAGRWASLP